RRAREEPEAMRERRSRRRNENSAAYVQLRTRHARRARRDGHGSNDRGKGVEDRARDPRSGCQCQGGGQERDRMRFLAQLERPEPGRTAYRDTGERGAQLRPPANRTPAGHCQADAGEQPRQVDRGRMKAARDGVISSEDQSVRKERRREPQQRGQAEPTRTRALHERYTTSVIIPSIIWMSL